MDPSRAFIELATLADGRVLTAGGLDGDSLTTRTAIWAPATGKWSAGPRTSFTRTELFVTTMEDGRVLAVGVYAPFVEPGAPEIYDPTADRWTPTGSLPWDDALVVGLAPAGDQVLAVTERTLPTTFSPAAALYDPARGTWTATWALQEIMPVSAVVPLPDDTVLLVGGTDVLRFDLQSGWRHAGTLLTARDNAAIAVLRDGRVLIAGGYVAEGPAGAQVTRILDTAEVFDPDTGISTEIARMPIAREQGVAVGLDDGSVLLAGGIEEYQAVDEDEENDLPPWCASSAFRVIRWVP